MSQRAGLRAAGNATGMNAALWQSPFQRACRGESTTITPVWLMRQAGRYMQHYRGIRSTRTFLELCKDPAAAAEVTVFARDWLGVDAAIIFSDILVVPEALGMALEFTTGDGPRLPRPITCAADVDALRDPIQAAADLGYVDEAIRLTVRGLPAGIPCIGFCGGPFTLASYAIEGGGSRQFAKTRAFMYREPDAWHRLLGRITACCATYLGNQVKAGATALQIFESWVGTLPQADFDEFVAPHLRLLVSHLPEGIPVILFGTNTGHLIERFAACGVDVVGIDATTGLDQAWQRLGGPDQVAVQGNLDPALLLADEDRLLVAAAAVLAQAGKRPGHIFNLGHGILKETDPERAKALVEFVHQFRSSCCGGGCAT